jgi:glycosyltransferase involved in cell wall biosynthesis
MADGITSVVYKVSKELVKRNNDVSVYTSNMLNLNENSVIPVNCLKINGVTVHYLKSLLHSRTLIFTPSLLYLLLKNLRDFDIVHIHDCRSFQGILTCTLARIKHVPYAFQPHGSYLPLLSDSPFTTFARIGLDKLICNKIVRHASKIIALTKEEAQEYLNIGVSAEKIAIIPNGVDLSEYEYLPPKGYLKKKYSISDDVKIVLYLGRINKAKGLDFLIKAYANMIKTSDRNDSRLVIAGSDDGYLRQIKQLIHFLNIENRVIFTGVLTESEKISALVDSSVVVYLNPSEPFGIVSLEAAAASKPVVVCENTEMANIVESGKFGFTVKYGSVSALSKVLAKIQNDDLLLNEMGQRGRKFIFDKFNWAIIVTQFVKIYENVIA